MPARTALRKTALPSTRALQAMQRRISQVRRQHGSVAATALAVQALLFIDEQLIPTLEAQAELVRQRALWTCMIDEVEEKHIV